MPSDPSTLPPLFVGNDRAELHTDARSLSDRVEKQFPGLNAYDPIGTAKAFKAKSFTIELPNLKLVASAISPSYVDRNGKQEMTLLLPLVGQCTVTVGQQTFTWGTGKAGIFMPEFTGRTIGQGNSRSLLMLQLQRPALERSARAMLGLQAEEPVNLRLDEARLTPTTFAGRNVELVLQKLCKLIELYHCDPKTLYQLGIEDLLYRHVIGLICPGLIAPADPAGLGPSTPQIKIRVTDSICDALQANLGKRWTLTDMEEISGLSARALQYAFKARFACSPMDWLREQRLQLARRRLLLDDFSTITQLALECGFGSASQFAAFYKARFGITPSKT